MGLRECAKTAYLSITSRQIIDGRGKEDPPEKSLIVHVDEGFDYLGWH